MHKGVGGRGKVREVKERVSLIEAAKEIGCAPQAVREHMKRGIWDLGDVVLAEERGKMTDAYYVFRRKLDKFLGKEMTIDRQDH